MARAWPGSMSFLLLASACSPVPLSTDGGPPDAEPPDSGQPDGWAPPTFCTDDAECGSGYYCAVLRSPRLVCGRGEYGLAGTCGWTTEECVRQLDLMRHGQTYFPGSVCLLYTGCAPRGECAPCTNDFDCWQRRPSRCIDIGGSMRCAADCTDDRQCAIGSECRSGSCVPRFGACVGTGGFCEACVSDEDCGGEGTEMECVTWASGERSCVDRSYPDACVSDEDCPVAPSGMHGVCLDERSNVLPGSDLYHRCTTPRDSTTGTPTCWGCSGAGCTACFSPPGLRPGGEVRGTIEGQSAHAGSCGPGLGGERAFLFWAQSEGTAVFELSSDSDLSLHVRRLCHFAETELGCASDGSPGDETVRVPLEIHGHLYVVVDANRADSSSEFVLRARLVPPTCGNGVVEHPGERCDDGNDAVGDGCTPECDLEPDVICRDAIDVTGPTMSGTTVGATNRYGSFCSGGGPDRVYRFVPGRPGQRGVVRVSMTSTDADLGLSAVQCDSGRELECMDLAAGETRTCSDCATVCRVDGTCDADEDPACRDCCNYDAWCDAWEPDACPDCIGFPVRCDLDDICEPHVETLTIEDHPGGVPIGVVVDSAGEAGSYELTFEFERQL